MTRKITKFMGLWLMIFMACQSASCAEEDKIYDKLYPGPKNSVRQETAQYPDADSPNVELVISGKISVTYLKPEENFAQKLLTHYVADKDGYRARYSFSVVEPVFRPPVLILEPLVRKTISIGGLKAAAG